MTVTLGAWDAAFGLFVLFALWYNGYQIASIVASVRYRARRDELTESWKETALLWQKTALERKELITLWQDHSQFWEGHARDLMVKLAASVAQMRAQNTEYEDLTTRLISTAERSLEQTRDAIQQANWALGEAEKWRDRAGRCSLS